MRYRRFGRTNLSMPVFSCGGMRYQFKWQDVLPAEISPDNQENLEATIRRAVELGINHIETARGYGTSEMQLGKILPTLPRDKIIVQTKVSPKETPEEFLRTFDTSMKYLRLDHVELLALHGINNRQLLHYTLRKGGCVEAARKLQKEGRVRFLGFSTHATTDIILEAVNSGEFDYLNVHWYFVNDLNWPAIAAARARGRLVRAVVRGTAAVRGRARPGEHSGDSAIVDLRAATRLNRLGQDALQPAGPGGPLVSR